MGIILGQLCQLICNILHFAGPNKERTVCSSPAIRLVYAEVQLIEALRYMSEGRRFDSRWGNWLIPSSRTVALGLTQLLPETSNRSISLGRG